MRQFMWMLASLGVLAVVGCTQSSPGPGASEAVDGRGTTGGGKVNTSLTGTIKIEGSSTVGPISTKAREKFNSQFPNVNVTIGEQGTSNGFSSFGKKEIDISDASRPIKAQELTACRDGDVDFYELAIAYDGLTFVVHAENDFCRQLTVEQLKKIFRKDMAAVTWREVDESWPDEKISVYAPGIQSGTHDYCMEVLGKADNVEMRADQQTTLSEDDKQLVTGVLGDKYAIGFFGFAYYHSSKEKLRAVSIVNSQGQAIEPSLATIENGSYEPFSRPLFIYVNQGSYQRAEVAEFVDFFLLNAADIVRQASYVPLPAEIYEINRAILDEERVGTHFQTADGKAREGTLVEILSTPAVSR
ncbi:MAG: PstS family phosphate ABC transporter substrate-binding protein [Planctomycetales bacterium]|nr:PstS family phosphate ABC transporter substrate-binding protein [Planctomycetales bacterium]